jgi:hypothetical protein
MTSFRHEFELKISRKMNTWNNLSTKRFVGTRSIQRAEQDRREENDRAWFSEQDNIKGVE